MSVLVELTTVQVQLSPDPFAQGLERRPSLVTHELYCVVCGAFFIIPAICGGKPVHAIFLVICHNPVLTLSGWNCWAAAKATKPADPIAIAKSRVRMMLLPEVPGSDDTPLFML